MYTRKKRFDCLKEIRTSPIGISTDRLNVRQIGRHLKVMHTNVMEWIKEHTEKLPEAPAPDEAYTVEMDELYNFIEQERTGSASLGVHRMQGISYGKIR